MRLLYVLTGLGFGGAETQVIALARGFHSRGWRVRVACLLADAERGDELRNLGIPVDTLGMTPGRIDFRAVVRLARLIREYRPDVVHSHMVHANLLTRVARFFCPMPLLVSTAHSQNEGHSWRMWALRLTEPLCDISTFVSEGARSSAIQRYSVSASKGIVVPNGVFLDQFDNLDDAAVSAVRRELHLTGFVWIAVGRLVPAKDHLTLLAAFSIVAAGKKSARLVIVGEGPLRKDLESRARELGIADIVRFTGMRHDVPVLLGAADGYVSSSAWEGLPLALIEAAAAGLPVVATAVGGSAEVVTGSFGVLVEPSAPEALAAEMLRLAERSVAERQAMGRAARAQARRFDLASVVDRWHQLFTDSTSRATK